jgi:hypothetical protein
MTKAEREARAIEALLESIRHCESHDPIAPRLSDEEDLICRGKIK